MGISESFILGYTIEHQELEEKLCETSTIIYPTAQYESSEDKFVSFNSTDAFDLDEYKVRLEVSDEDAVNVEDVEYQIHITTKELMKEIEKVEAE